MGGIKLLATSSRGLPTAGREPALPERWKKFLMLEPLATNFFRRFCAFSRMVRSAGRRELFLVACLRPCIVDLPHPVRTCSQEISWTLQSLDHSISPFPSSFEHIHSRPLLNRDQSRRKELICQGCLPGSSRLHLALHLPSHHLVTVIAVVAVAVAVVVVVIVVVTAIADEVGHHRCRRH